jgi:WD40 repeat protein
MRITLLVLACSVDTSFLTAAEPDFARDVQPVFRKYCNGCHNAKEKEGGLVLEDFAHALKGGDSGEAIVAGDSAKSELWKRVNTKDDTRMPPEGHTAPKPSELALLKAWIDAGAKAPAGGLAATGLVTPQIAPQGKVREPVTALAVDPNGRFLAVARPNVVEIHPLPLAQKQPGFSEAAGLHKLTGHTGAISDVQLSRDGKTLVVAAGETGLSGEVTLWNTADWSRAQTITGHRDTLYAVALSPDGNVVAAASYDREIRIWNVRRTQEAEGLQPLGVGESARLTLAGHNDAVYGIAFHPNGKLLASASGDRTVKLWDLASGQRLDTFAQPSKEQYSVAISPNGKYVAAGGVDMRVRIWEITQNGKEGTNPLLYARFAHEGPILKVVFSPDGRLLVSASEDRRIKVWETQTFTQVALLERQPDWPAAVAFSPDNRTLFGGRMNGDVVTYPVNPNWADSRSELQHLAETPGFDNDVTTPMTAMVNEVEPNDVPAQAQPLTLPAQVAGVFNPVPSPPSAGERVRERGSSDDADLYRFDAKQGQVWLLETNAARMKSPADTKIEVLHADGRPVQRGLLQAVRDSWINFRPIDSSQTLVRVEFWEEMDLDQLMYMNGEVGKLYRAPRGPDSGYDFYENAGKRRTVFDTTPIAHAKDEPVYIVEAYPPDAKIVDNGLPLFPLFFVNDDDGERELGSDSRLTFTAPADGTYIARVTDSRGFTGEKFTYQLTIRPPKPDFNVRVDTKNVKVNAGSGQRLKFSVDRIDNYNDAIRIEVANLPMGYHVATPTVIEPGHLTTFSVLTAKADAQPASKEAWDAVTITATGFSGKTTISKQQFSVATTTVISEEETEPKLVGNLGEVKLEKPPQIRVVLLPDNLETTASDGGLVLTPGTTITANIRVERNGFDGDVKFDVDNLPHGVIVDNIGLSGVLVRANETERQIFLTARPWVQDTTRWIDAVAQVQGNQASNAVPLHIRRPSSVAAK